MATQPALDHLPEKERKNVHNNHVERGTEVAPKSESARIKANIAAIETMKKLEASGEAPTAADMKKLRAFSGWGGLGKAFSDWDTSRQLRQLLGDKLYDEGAEMSRNSAYFTPAYIVRCNVGYCAVQWDSRVVAFLKVQQVSAMSSV